MYFNTFICNWTLNNLKVNSFITFLYNIWNYKPKLRNNDCSYVIRLKFWGFVDVAFDVDDVIDISELRGYGLQPGEEELPDLVDERQNGNQRGYSTISSRIYGHWMYKSKKSINMT
jgi:hypothetical protein